MRPTMNSFSISTVITLLSLPGLASADFTLTTEFTVNPSGLQAGITFDGTNWHIGDAFEDTFFNYDADFTFLGTTAVTGVGDMRGMTYDSNSGNLFVGDYESGIVREVTVGGVEIQQFSTGVVDDLNALAFNPADDSIWLAYFDSGVVENRTRTGTLISSFVTPENWTGLAYDGFNNSLLLLETGDTLFEYQTDGVLIGEIIDTDIITGNGFGLAYDSSIGRLWVTSTDTTGRITIFDDPSRVPEPGGSALLAACVALLFSSRRRRCALRVKEASSG